MKQFLIYFNFDIKDPRTELVVEAEHRTFEVEAETRKGIDTDKVREKIRKIAYEARSQSNYYVSYANYYKIEEVDTTESGEEQ